ncbi:MAG: LysE family translocator [Halobacteria archaeon]|nr:LysE family translocator [Halobacteria archaeon]
MGVVSSVFAGGLLGLSLSAPPGPMNAVIAEESVLNGRMAGFKAGLGTMTADAIFCVLAFAGAVTFIRGASALKGAMLGVGGLLMLYFAYGAGRSAREEFEIRSENRRGEIKQGKNSKGFYKALALALTNPFQILWWLTIGVSLIEPGTVRVFGDILITTGGPTILVGFFGGILLWVIGFPTLLTEGGKRIDTLRPVVAYLSAVLLAVFGALFLYESAGTLGLIG